MEYATSHCIATICARIALVIFRAMSSMQPLLSNPFYSHFKNNYCSSVDFAMQILQCNATLDIFESGMSTEQPKHFHRTRSYWAKKAHELDKLGFSMTISCVHDTDFDARFTDTDMFARMHISIVTKEQRERGVNNTIYESRGFQPE